MNWLDLCRNRPCIACGRDDGTIVPAHANHLGKGVSLKCPDFSVIPLCWTHHQYLDGSAPREEKRAFWRENWTRHLLALAEAGLIQPTGQRTIQRRPPVSSKVLVHPGYSR